MNDRWNFLFLLQFYKYFALSNSLVSMKSEFTLYSILQRIFAKTDYFLVKYLKRDFLEKKSSHFR